MLKQLDNDRNIVLVMSPFEYARLSEIQAAAVEGMILGVASVTPEARPVFKELQAAGFLLTDEELIEALVAPHRNHDGDDLEEITKLYKESVPKGRAGAISLGYAQEA